MKTPKPAAYLFFASGAVLALSAVLPTYAGTQGRYVDQPRSSLAGASQAGAAGMVYPSRHAYTGRRIDQPQAIYDSRGRQQVELAAFEAGRPSTPARGGYPYIGRHVDGLR